MSAQKKESWITVIFVQGKKESIPVYLGNSYFRALILHWNFIVQNMWVNLVFPQIYFFLYADLEGTPKSNRRHLCRQNMGIFYNS